MISAVLAVMYVLLAYFGRCLRIYAIFGSRVLGFRV